jgi:hypothetical protein
LKKPAKRIAVKIKQRKIRQFPSGQKNPNEDDTLAYVDMFMSAAE